MATQPFDLVGNTPLLALDELGHKLGLAGRILAKLEQCNPLGSVKDRAAKGMLMDALSRGQVRPDTVVVEPTSGNTGIALAYICTAMGLELTLTMPDTMSVERRMLLQALGANLVLTDGQKGMAGAIDMAMRIADESHSAFVPDQFNNPANARAHYETTAPEILQQTGGDLAAFVAGVGSGGTLCGTARRLKRHLPFVRAVAVEPAESAVLSGDAPGSHGIQGIGAGFMPGLYDAGLVDEVQKVSTQQAVDACRLLAATHGLLAGFSSGAALYAAIQVARRPALQGKQIVVLFPDSGERYLSTSLFSGTRAG